MLVEAKTAAAAGNLLAPPGDSAYDKYRAVRSLDPDNPEARSGLAALPGLARERFEQALGANKLATARSAGVSGGPSRRRLAISRRVQFTG